MCKRIQGWDWLWGGDLDFEVWKTMWKTHRGVGFYCGLGRGKLLGEMMGVLGRCLDEYWGDFGTFILQSVSK